MGDNHNSRVKEEVCENFCLIGIRRCKTSPADVVKSWQGAPEADMKPELGRWEPLVGGSKPNTRLLLCATVVTQ